MSRDAISVGAALMMGSAFILTAEFALLAFSPYGMIGWGLGIFVGLAIALFWLVALLFSFFTLSRKSLGPWIFASYPAVLVLFLALVSLLELILPRYLLKAILLDGFDLHLGLYLVRSAGLSNWWLFPIIPYVIGWFAVLWGFVSRRRTL